MGRRAIILYVCDMCERGLLEPSSGVVLPLDTSFVVGGTGHVEGGAKTLLVNQSKLKRAGSSNRDEVTLCLKCLLDVLPKPTKDWGADRKKKVAAEDTVYLEKLEALDAELSSNEFHERKASGV